MCHSGKYLGLWVKSPEISSRFSRVFICVLALSCALLLVRPYLRTHTVPKDRIVRVLFFFSWPHPLLALLLKFLNWFSVYSTNRKIGVKKWEDSIARSRGDLLVFLPGTRHGFQKIVRVLFFFFMASPAPCSAAESKLFLGVLHKPKTWYESGKTR